MPGLTDLVLIPGLLIDVSVGRKTFSAALGRHATRERRAESISDDNNARQREGTWGEGERETRLSDGRRVAAARLLPETACCHVMWRNPPRWAGSGSGLDGLPPLALSAVSQLAFLHNNSSAAHSLLIILHASDPCSTPLHPWTRSHGTHHVAPVALLWIMWGRSLPDVSGRSLPYQAKTGL